MACYRSTFLLLLYMVWDPNWIFRERFESALAADRGDYALTLQIMGLLAEFVEHAESNSLYYDNSLWTDSSFTLMCMAISEQLEGMPREESMVWNWRHIISFDELQGTRQFVRTGIRHLLKSPIDGKQTLFFHASRQRIRGPAGREVYRYVSLRGLRGDG
ncbi:MAG: hypothetical protein LUD76_11215 [Alistipes sp.]|nr:hypothetical protein [Alistipes sp.]